MLLGLAQLLDLTVDRGGLAGRPRLAARRRSPGQLRSSRSSRLRQAVDAQRARIDVGQQMPGELLTRLLARAPRAARAGPKASTAITSDPPSTPPITSQRRRFGDSRSQVASRVTGI